MVTRSLQWILSTLCVAPLFLAACAEPVAESISIEDSPSAPGPTGDLKGDSAHSQADECPESPSYYLEFLDDTRCRKVLPTNRDRDLACPTAASDVTVFSPNQGADVEYRPAEQDPVIDENALLGLVPDDMRITVVMVRRVDGRPYYRYLSNGRQDDIFQPWSTTKFMAVANAGANLRLASNGQVGLNGTVDGIPVGDLVSIVHNYDEEQYTSNGLARWFLNVGDRNRLDALIHEDWLQRPSGESLGGNYGAPTPPIGYEVMGADGSVAMQAEDRSGPNNQLSTLSIAEFLKRVVMHREDPEFALPGLQWDDVKTLLYGAEESTMFDDQTPQGMQGDTTVYLQAGLDMAEIDRRSQGQWRIFSKLGFGYSRGGEFVNAGYGCFPVLDETGAIKVDHGKEFFIVSQFGAKDQYVRADKELAEIYGRIVNGILSGTIK